MEKKWS